MKFDRFHTVENLPRVARPRLLTSEMLSTMNDLLRNDDELTARRLSDKLHEEYANLPDISLSTIKKQLSFIRNDLGAANKASFKGDIALVVVCINTAKLES